MPVFIDVEKLPGIITLSEAHYLQRDRVRSTGVVADSTRALLARLFCDPLGKQRNVDGTGSAT